MTNVCVLMLYLLEHQWRTSGGFQESVPTFFISLTFLVPSLGLAAASWYDTYCSWKCHAIGAESHTSSSLSVFVFMSPTHLQTQRHVKLPLSNTLIFLSLPSSSVEALFSMQDLWQCSNLGLIFAVSCAVTYPGEVLCMKSTFLLHSAFHKAMPCTQ